MKKFVSKLSMFIAFAAVFYIIMILIYGMIIPAPLVKNFDYFGIRGFTGKRFREAKETKNVDVVFIGSSHAYRGYDPRIFRKAGISSFNLGSSSQTPLQTKYLVNKYIKNLNPRFVIVDVYPILFGVDGLESQIDLISSGLMDKEMIKMAFSMNNITLYNSLIFGAVNDVFHLKEQKNTDRKGDTYIQGGYVQSYESLKFKKKRLRQRINISDVQLTAFKEMITFFKLNKIKYMIVQAPFPKSNYDSYTNNDAIDQLFSGLGDYYNFNKILNLPDSMYYDDSHLNQFGVNVYDRKLLEILTKKGELGKIAMSN